METAGPAYPLHVTCDNCVQPVAPCDCDIAARWQPHQPPISKKNMENLATLHNNNSKPPLDTHTSESFVNIRQPDQAVEKSAPPHGGRKCIRASEKEKRKTTK